MALSRRGFLKFVLAAAATTTLMSNPVLAKIVDEGSVPKSLDKWGQALVTGRKLLAENDRVRLSCDRAKNFVADPSQFRRDEIAKSQIWKIGDDFFKIIEDFDPNTTDAYLVDRLLQGYYKPVAGSIFDEKNEGGVRLMTEGLFAVGSAREFISVHRVPFATTKMNNFYTFAMNYKDLIVGDSSAARRKRIAMGLPLYDDEV